MAHEPEVTSAGAEPAGDGRPATILPAGTVTFLLADIEPPPTGPGATPGGGGPSEPRAVIDAAVARHGGVQPEGQPEARPSPTGRDRVVAAFTSATDAVAAAFDVQRARDPAVRIGIHTGEVLLRDDRHYTGFALARCARLRDVGHCGQTLLTSVTASLVGNALPAGAWLDDLGVHRLRDLSPAERVFQLRHPELPADLPPLRSLDALTTNLPAQLTSFVGRTDELAAVELLLDSERLVTLTGPGGSGKTRLALQAAAELADRWPDGVWWIDLAPVSEPGVVAELVASTIGVLVEPAGGPLRALALQLRDRRLLVCLDNCEHLIEASAALAEELLRACPEVSVLTTSREPLGVPGETTWRVPSLSDTEAISLFMERASRVRPWFTLDATNDAAVRTLCRRLDGMPLAIELAAAWLRTLTPAQIAAALDDRFALLVRGPRGAVPRQQTLVASIDWSHDLLDDVDRAVFRRLAVFAGGFTLTAARHVCAGEPVTDQEVLTALARLVDKSLVVMDEHGGEARYRLLETIRQYARDRLHEAGEVATTRDRHLDHYLALADEAEPHMVTAEVDTWLARLETEHENLRAALDWGLSADDPERGRRLASPLFWLWYLHGHANDGIEFLQRAIGRAPGDRTALQARLLSGLAAVAIGSRQFSMVADYAQRGLEVATEVGDDSCRGRCLMLLAVIQQYIDDDDARRLLEEARACADAAGDSFIADRALTMLGGLASQRDRYDEARPLLDESFRRCLARGDRAFAAMALDYRVDEAVLTGDLELAERLATQALEVAQPLGDYFSVGLSTCHLAYVRGLRGDIDGGRRLMERVVRSVEGADDAYVPRMAPVLGRLCQWTGDLEAAVGWYERDVRYPGPMADSVLAARSLPGLGDALRRLGRIDEAREHVDRALAIARDLDIPHSVAEALDQSALLVADDDPDRAEDLLHEALAIRAERGLRLVQVDSLDTLAGLAAHGERFTEAARVLGACEAARRAMGYPRPPIDQPAHEALVDSLRAALGDDGFAGPWRDGTGLTLDAAVAYVRRARGSRGRPSTGWASLTPTELDVVRCVAEGLTNPEIGSRLLMSRGTVKTHLSHIYAKLGVANRTELATLAARRLR